MKVALLPGDGIGQEVTAQEAKVPRALEEPLEFEQASTGEQRIELCGAAVAPAKLDVARRADAIPPGAVEHRPVSEGAGILRLSTDLRHNP